MITDFLSLCKILTFIIILMSVIPHNVIAEKEKQSLQIGVKKRPKECPMKSKRGDILYAEYTGYLDDGTEFISSSAKEKPLKFVLGHGQVLKGWDQGLIGMCVGEHRTLYIPPHLGHGKAGAPPRVPKSATLIFDVELVKIRRKKYEM